jgi:DNA gyrase subunit A
MDDPATTSGEKRVRVNIEDELRESYLAYAMSVIIGRALPDVRDGLKPVHRRVLFAQHEQKNTFQSPYKKSARIVGDVIGKYHPHGDTAVYDTMVRMAQGFSMRYPLVDGQGNFGSVDGDPPAAMRYTEVRMTRLSGELLADLEKETVDWQPNYDGSEREPVVLPAAFPNLLVNGSGGIAVGMATNMPPHNLAEVVRATLALVADPTLTVDQLMAFVPGPDFPTGGFLVGREGIGSAYRTGRGIVRMRARTEFELDEQGEESAIVVSEIPYQVNKARLLERIDELVRDKKIEGIRLLRDESDRQGMRIYIGLKRGVMGQVVLNQLFAMTAMQASFGIINLAIVNGQPRVLDLRELLVHFINHRRDVVTRRCRYELRKAEERAHILEGYLKALDHIDPIVALIKASRTPEEARQGLMASFAFSEVQAQSILELRLQRLTGFERDKIREEYLEIQATITRLQAILGSDALLMGVIGDELRQIEAQYTDPRRTEIIAATGEMEMEDLIADEDMVVITTADGYIKRTLLAEYRTQRRGGRGRMGMTTKTEDVVTNLFVASAHTLLLVFTNRGQVYGLKVWELPRGGITASGKAIVNLIPIEKEELIRSIVAVDDLDDATKSLVFVTRQGTVKRTMLGQYKNLRSSGLIALRLDDGDDLVSVQTAPPSAQVLLMNAQGKAIIFGIDDIRATGRATFGVRGIRLQQRDEVVAMDILEAGGAPGTVVDEAPPDDTAAVAPEPEEPPEEAEDAFGAEGLEEVAEVDDATPTVLVVTRNGFGKRTPLAQFRLQRRGGMGLRALPFSPRNGPVVSMCRVRSTDDVMVVTDGGTVIRMPVGQIRTCSRAARGVSVIKLDSGERVVAIYAVPPGEDEVAEGTPAELGEPTEVVGIEGADRDAAPPPDHGTDPQSEE